MSKRKYWTPLKIFVAVPMGLGVLMMIIGLIQKDGEAIAGGFGVFALFGLMFMALNVNRVV